MPAARIFLQLIADFVVYLGLLIGPRKAIAAEKLFLRRQLALYQERKVDPRQIDPATRITLALLSRLLMRRKPGLGPRGDQRWRTFLRNRAAAIVACDFCVAVTAKFRVLYIFVIIEHATPRLLHWNVTSNPTAAWTLQQWSVILVFADHSGL